MKSVLIIGMGRTGRHLASKMQALGNDVMIVDKNPAIIEALSGRFTDSNICDCTNDTIIKALSGKTHIFPHVLRPKRRTMGGKPAKRITSQEKPTNAPEIFRNS